MFYVAYLAHQVSEGDQIGMGIAAREDHMEFRLLAPDEIQDVLDVHKAEFYRIVNPSRIRTSQ